MAELSLETTPGQDESAAPTLLGVTGALYGVALCLFGGRIYERVRHRRLGWDDYTITFAMVLALVEWALVIAAVQYGAGRHNHYVSHKHQVHALHVLYPSTVLWPASMMFIKISIACMLLRIKHTRPWLIFLWTMIAIQIASCIASLVFLAVQCIPLDFIWDPTNHPNAVCTKPIVGKVSIYVNSGIGIATDLILATIPIIFIRRMQGPFREKIVLSCLMGLGVFASVASIVKTTYVEKYGVTGDTLWDSVGITLWSILEEQTGIIAACIPCLKSPFERTLYRFGILTSRPSNKHSRRYQARRYHTNESHKLSTLRSKTSRKGIEKSAGSSVEEFSIGKSLEGRSEGTVWPGTLDGNENDRTIRLQVADGGIMRTLELEITSESNMDSESAEASPRDGKNATPQKSWDAV